MTLGVITQGLGLALLRAINLGVDPCSCLTQGVEKLLHIGFGTCQLLCHMVTFVFVICMDMSRIGFGTVGNMVFLGYISDFFTWVFSKLLPAGFFDPTVTRYLLLIPSLAVFLLGAAVYMTSGLGSSPYDALPFILSERWKRFSFRAIRITWDVAFTVAGALLGGTVGVVTVSIALFLGPLATWVQKKLETSLFVEGRT